MNFDEMLETVDKIYSYDEFIHIIKNINEYMKTECDKAYNRLMEDDSSNVSYYSLKNELDEKLDSYKQQSNRIFKPYIIEETRHIVRIDNSLVVYVKTRYTSKYDSDDYNYGQTFRVKLTKEEYAKFKMVYDV